MTSSGLEIFPYARNLCREFEKLQMKMDDMNGIQSGSIRIGTFSSVATHWLPNIIAVFQKEYPNIQYELLLGDYEEIEKFPVKALLEDSFIMLEKGVKAEITDIFVKNGLTPNPKFTTFDDYAVMSMVEKGLGISILPSLILKRIAYDIVIKPLDVPAYRTIGVAMRSRKELSLAAHRFLDFLDYREEQVS